MGNHVRGRAVVRDAPDPGAQRTAAIEPRETLPQRDLDILFEVAAQIGVGFIAARHAGEGGAEASDGLRTGAVLFAFVPFAFRTFVSHALFVGGDGNFSQEAEIFSSAFYTALFKL